MTAPNKPWEANNAANSITVFSNPGLQLTSNVARPSNVVRTNAPPPLPQRSRNTNTYSRPPYGSSYNPYYGNGVPIIGNSYGMPSYGMRNPMDGNRYIQLAEESAAPAFESIENFVRGFTSVTYMLDSTFQALQMSFRAILGVAENMSRMRAAMIDFTSILSIFKVINQFYRKILYYLGILKGTDMSWKEAEAAVAKEVGKQAVSKSKRLYWPVIAFLSAIIALPALVYRYTEVPTNLNEDVSLVVTYDFDPTQDDELSVQKGDVIQAKRSDCQGKKWIYARKGLQKGYVPFNRVAVLEGKLKIPVKQGQQPVKSTPTASIGSQVLQATKANPQRVPKTTTKLSELVPPAKGLEMLKAAGLISQTANSAPQPPNPNPQACTHIPNSNPPPPSEIPKASDAVSQMTNLISQLASDKTKAADPISQAIDLNPQKANLIPKAASEIPKASGTIYQMAHPISQLASNKTKAADPISQVVDPNPQTANLIPKVASEIPKASGPISQMAHPISQLASNKTKAANPIP